MNSAQTDQDVNGDTCEIKKQPEAAERTVICEAAGRWIQRFDAAHRYDMYVALSRSYFDGGLAAWAQDRSKSLASESEWTTVDFKRRACVDPFATKEGPRRVRAWMEDGSFIGDDVIGPDEYGEAILKNEAHVADLMLLVELLLAAEQRNLGIARAIVK